MKKKLIKQKTEDKCKPYLIAITGSFGTGKSVVGNILRKLKNCVVDTDDIVRAVLANRNKITVKIVKEFGDEVLNNKKGKYINKTLLANIVFNNKLRRKKLESIIHPEVENKLKQFISKHCQKSVIFVLIPLLFECKLQKKYNETWCVICKENIRLVRLLNKGYLISDIKKRIKAQLSQNVKAKKADFVIDNSKTIEHTMKQVMHRLKLMAQLNRSSHLFSCK